MGAQQRLKLGDRIDLPCGHTARVLAVQDDRVAIDQIPPTVCTVPQGEMFAAADVTPWGAEDWSDFESGQGDSDW